MKYKELKYEGKTYTEEDKIENILKKNDFTYFQCALPSACFAATGRRAMFNLDTGVVSSVDAGVTALIVPVGSTGWYRCILTATANATSPGTPSSAPSLTGTLGDVSFLGTGSQFFYAWGRQLETGSRATSYIATGAATVTRAAETLSVPTANIPGFNSAGYTLFADFRMQQTTVINSGIVWLGNVAETSFASLGLNSSGNGTTQINSGGVNYQFLNSDTASVNRRKNALSAAANSGLAAFSGPPAGACR